MSGHSKWHSIRHKKAIKDARRGKLFTKLIKELTVAARTGGGDPGGNPRLRAAIATARAYSLPQDNIERAVKKGTGELEGVEYEDVSYEGYGAGGMAVMLECVTDNRKRTVADVRYLFNKNGGNLGENGCVGGMFERAAHLRVRAVADEETVLEAAVGAGATDVRSEEDGFLVISPADKLAEVRKGLEAAGIAVEGAETVLEPQSHVRLTGADAARAVRLIEALEDHDDVQRVSANFEIDEEELERLSA